MNILYIGPNQSEWADSNCHGSLAAAKWSRGLQTAMAKLCNLTTLSHTYTYPWPKGRKLWAGHDRRYYPEDWVCISIQYPAIKWLRELWWKIAYPIAAWRAIKKQNIETVILYNCCEPWQRWTMRMIKMKYPHLPVFPIILDGRDPVKDKWTRLGWAARWADGFIPLSWWMYENLPKHIPDKHMYHMDGGADGWRGTPYDCHRPYSLVHTGELDDRRGLGFMLDVMEMILTRRKDVKFVFTGRVGLDSIRERFGNNSQIEILGFVEEDKLGEICKDASVFLNVRNPAHPDNVLNYPSKVPQYLSFGRPVISTHLVSLSPDYAQVLNFPTDDTVAAYVSKVEEVLSWPQDRRDAEYTKIRNWFNKRKRWEVLALGLVKWLEQIVQGGGNA